MDVSPRGHRRVDDRGRLHLETWFVPRDIFSEEVRALPVIAVVFTLSALLLLYGRGRIRPERR